MNKFGSFTPKNAFLQGLVKIGPVNLEKKMFLNFDNVLNFLIFRKYHLLEKGWVLHLNKLVSPSPKDALCQIYLKLVQWFLINFFFVKVCLLYLNHLPMEKGWALHFIKLESPLPKDALFKVWLKLTQWFWRR